MLNMLKQLKGGFWLSVEELTEELEAMGFVIEGAEDEQLDVVFEEEGEEVYKTLYLVIAGSTVAVKSID